MRNVYISPGKLSAVIKRVTSFSSAYACFAENFNNDAARCGESEKVAAGRTRFARRRRRRPTTDSVPIVKERGENAKRGRRARARAAAAAAGQV